MRFFFIFCLYLLFNNSLFAQLNIAVLKEAYLVAKDDSTRQNVLLNIVTYYNEINRDSALYYNEQRLVIAKKSGYKLLEAAVLNLKGYQKIQKGEYAEALKCLQESLKITQDSNNLELNHWIIVFPNHIPGKERFHVMSSCMHQFGILMRETENLPKEIEFFKKALLLARQVNSIDRQMISNSNLGSAYLRKGMFDSALYHAQQSDSFALLPEYKGNFRGRNIASMGDVYFKQGDYLLAKLLYLKGLDLSINTNNLFNVAIAKHKLSQLYLKIKQNDSALIYAKDNLSLMYFLQQNFANFQLNLGTLYEDIFLAYKQNNQKDSAYKYLLIASQIKDSLSKVRIANLSAFQNVSFEETLRLESLESEQIQTESKIRIYSLLAGLMVVSLIGIILLRNNNQRKKSNLLLTSQKNEIEQQKRQVEESMERLQSTQSQLVHAEKMASLGELTAGIAHEIQNPLNFVNNFAEVNTELIDELQQELKAGNTEEAIVISNDIKANETKITHHGKRADSIVKGMLHHSRQSSGQKELTDINALCDEYLRLSYHGLRAKDKSFNAEFDTNFDSTLPAISVIPQDIGRVILNLINNAFYAVHARHKMEQQGDYKPKVTISTRKEGKRIVIEVADNGTGMPEQVREKIFQPFFTTKPTGEGTGLGLSLSYDIITKGHGGRLKVETLTVEAAAQAGKRDAGSSFVIELPI
ncbi:MAG: ATP-binding protein [Chitinophagia bacterium]